MKTNKTNFFWVTEDWRDQIYQLLMKKAPTQEYNEDEEVGAFLMDIIAQIRFHSDELERFLLRKCNVGDISDFGEYEGMVMAQLDQSETYQKLKQQRIPTIKMSKKQLSLAKDLIGFILTQRNSGDYLSNLKAIGFGGIWNLCRKNHEKKFQGDSKC